jgi:hypothetical protein
VIHSKADYLLTGDSRYFDHPYGKRIEGVLVVGRRSILRAGPGLKLPFSPHSFTLVY